MSGKRFLALPDALRDLRQATAHYASVAGSSTALRFSEAIQEVLTAIADRPGIGSPRYSEP